MRKSNTEGVNIVKYFEGLRLIAYKDIKGIDTIGYGSTSGVVPGQTITESQADLLLRHDLSTAEDCVERSVRPVLNDNQFSALVSLVFNIGSGAFEKSTLLRLLNQNKYDEAADQFLVWCKANGADVPGLLARRRAERDLFLKAVV